MAADPSLYAPTPDPERLRSEPREDTVCIVEYAGLPRSPSERPRIGFTRDLSTSGMCIGVDEAEPAGALLRVVLRDLAGCAVRDVVARVVWCSPARGGRHWLGLDLLSEREPRGRFSPL